ncbi:hypothetical protein CONLIGDRAFT_229671 [Coniochaeta ligniaria NRRL 30616]|uniref:Uncharacterized protein n=1 Tax=Coniochaeta ligniaria NRRL 30616 TaxID=1408157 RepID=A0A1J7IV58_9PEZI|nr:hypothetical protein CONLIGDRAFT_229671 [Coniochaeta ligniaria NRRL 30616]
MPSNKKRLYVALYPSGVANNPERLYHWGFIIGPKEDKKGKATELPAGLRCHVRNRGKKNVPGGEWYYEERPLANAQTSLQLLARIVVAKIEDEQRLLKIIRDAPVISGDSNWRCRTWVADILQRLKADGKAVGSSELDWARIEAFGRQYVASKNASKRYDTQDLVLGPKPTYDLIEDKEIMP